VTKPAEMVIRETAEKAGAIQDEPELTKLVRNFNERFYVVEDFGGRCLVCWETENPTTNTLELHHQSFADFRKRWNRFIQVGEKDGEPIRKLLADAWLDNQGRRQYVEVAFAPGETLSADIRNLWRGFAFEPRKGDCRLYLEHLKTNIAGGNEEHFDWLLNWMAFKVQNPGKQSYTAVVLKGREGVGKNMAAEPFAKLFGPHHLSVTRREHVAGHFNAHLRACCVLIANEAFFAGDRQHQATLKGLITDDTLMIEAKGIDAMQSKNRLSLIMLSNESWVVPAGVDARRFAVFNVSDERKEDTQYFGKIRKELDAGGMEALLFYLQTRPLKDFDQHKALRTDALAEQQSLSLRGAESLWYECLFRGELPGATLINDATYLRTERLLTWASIQRRREWSDITAEQLGLLLGQNPRGAARGMEFKKAKKNGLRVWQIEPLETARKLWNARRFTVKWDDSNDWEKIPVGDETTATLKTPEPAKPPEQREPGSDDIPF